MTQSQSASHELHDLSVHALTQALAAKQVSAVEVAQHFLDRANAHANLGAFVAIQPETTLAQARAADARIANGTAGTLEGVPVAHALLSRRASVASLSRRSSAPALRVVSVRPPMGAAPRLTRAR